MNKLPVASNTGELASAVHLELIQNLAGWSDGNGVEEVEAYHRAVFLHHYGKELERCEQQRRIHEDRLVHLTARLNETQAKLTHREPWVPADHQGEPDVAPSQPWNGWDRLMFAAGLLGIAGLLIFGILNVSFNLLESGIITFLDHPVRAYFWAALLPVGALAVKIGWDFLRNPRARNVYVWSCLIAGLAGVAVWVAAYAAIYPTLSKTTAEHIQSLRVLDSADAGAGPGNADALTSGRAKRMDMILVASQAAAEIFLSAVLGIYLTILYARHRPVRLAANPAFTQWEQERKNLETDVGETRLALADAQGEESRLRHQLAAFIAFAKSLYHKEVSMRRDQSHQRRMLLQQISRQFKRQLDEVDQPGDASSSVRVEPLSLSGKGP